MVNNIHGGVGEFKGREFYLNADFDRTLRGIPSFLEEESHTFVHDMAQHFLFAASPEDSVILHRPFPQEFLGYLAEKRIPLPALVVHPAYTPHACFMPFGWNEHTERLSRRYARPSPHPSLDAVREANSRVFSHAFESRMGGLEQEKLSDESGASGGLFDSLSALETHLHQHPSSGGWMVKGNHGHAGTANRRISGATLEDEEKQAIDLLFREDRWVCLEPWHDRLLDMSANFEVDGEGVIRGFRGHELVNSRDGAFLGVKIAPSGQPPEPWRADLEKAAASLGKALQGIGYFGPVSMDAYVRKSSKGPILRPWVDINARLSMALPAHGLAARLPGRHIFWQWAKPRKLDLPSDYRELKARLGAADFDPDTRRGILVVSPLAPVEGDRRPKRVGFVISARDESDLESLQDDFRKALGRGR